MISARPTTAPSGNPFDRDLASTTRSGSRSRCSQANMRPVRPNPVCTSSATNSVPASRHQPPQLEQKGRRRHDESALAQDRLDHRAGHLGERHVRLQEAVQLGGAVALARDREPVDLRRERPEAILVGRGLAGQAERQQGAAVEAGVERQHRRAAGGPAGDLDGVLDRLGARVEQRRLARRRRWARSRTACAPAPRTARRPRP